jgi:predicted nucleotidyltransferase
MNASEVEERLRTIAPRLRELSVRSLRLFGSAARGEAGPNSDIDILVEFEGSATFDGYMCLREELEAQLRSRVDRVTSRSLRPELREQLLREAVRIA